MAGVTPQDIYKALIAAGASSTQAIGIMANMINESSLDVEAKGLDTNGYYSYGLVQWNSAPGNYPDASAFVTGNPQQDLQLQINFLKESGAFSRADGSTGAAAAGNFAAQYENCQGCQPGGSQWTQRSNNAATVEGWISSGKWGSYPGSSGGGSGGNGGGGGSTTSGNNQAVLLSSGPGGFSWIPNPFWDIWNNLFGNPTGGIIQAPSSNPLSSLTDIAKGIAAIATDLAKVFQWLSWIFQPSSWLRIGAFLVGVASLGASIYMFKEAI